MSDDDAYLWDGSGTPDPEVERLERLLGRFRLDPRRAPRAGTAEPGSGSWLPAAAAALAIGLLTLAALPPPTPVWTAAAVAGRSRIGGRELRGTSPLPASRWIETDAGARARLQADSVGVIELDGESRARLTSVRPGEHRVELERGRLEARVWAPPRVFFVDTRAARAADLGCAYTLAVDPAGAGRLTVTAGWVALEGHDLVSLVPAGASCAIRAGVGPGTPVFDDASVALGAALARLETGPENGREGALAAALAGARTRDALTLWHLLGRVRAGERGAVHDRLAELRPAPAGAPRDRVLAGDARALAAWWDSLGLGGAPAAEPR